MALELVPAPSALDRIGFELGWDYAHHGLCPPAPYDRAESPLRHGLRAGRATFGARQLRATAPVRQWLQLRLSAWLRGRSVETVQVTPHYLAQIAVDHCPVTRRPIAAETLDAPAGAIDRVRHDAAYAAGNLVMLGSAAHHAKAAHAHASALDTARRAAEAGASIDGLYADAWMRLAVLCSFVEPLPHAQACAIPLRVLPPNRLRLFNPAQALQAFLSRQLLSPGWSARLRRIAALLPAQPARRALFEFGAALLPRVLEAGHPSTPMAARWALEDAWRAPLVIKRWQAFAGALGAAGCESLLAHASAAIGLASAAVSQLADGAATDGWALASRGYVVPPERSGAIELPARRIPARPSAGMAAAPVQACLPL